MAVTEKLSSLVQRQFPAFYQEEGEKFLSFVKAYYEYLETSGKQQDTQRNIQSYKDIDTTLDQFIKYFRSELMAEIPNEALADKRLLAKRIKDFYQTKGTIESYKLLFKILYNEDVEINFPANQMLKISDGDFRIDRYLVTHHDPRTYTLIGKTIIGTDSQAEALVEDVRKLISKRRDINQILLSNIKGSFTHLETIKIKDVDDGYTPIVECGINNIQMISKGGEYRIGDVIELFSTTSGEKAKAVVTNTLDLQAKVNFNLIDGGSGYVSTENNAGTIVEYIGGDGDSPASFKIQSGSLTDTFALSLNVNKFASNTIAGELAPRVAYRDTSFGIMDTHANTLLGSPEFGFRESTENLTAGQNFKTNDRAVLVLANTSNPGVIVGDSLYGVTSSANATVNVIKRAHNGTNVVLSIDGYKNFQAGEKVNKASPTGTTVGTVPASGFLANTVGRQILAIANTDGGGNIELGDELVGVKSGTFGVVKLRISVSGTETYDHDGDSTPDRKITTVIVGANNTANVSSQFDAGPLNRFQEGEGIRRVNTSAIVANVVSDTANTSSENIYTKLSDSLLFLNEPVGTIARLDNRIGGTNFGTAPKIKVEHRNVSSLGIGEAYLTLQTDNVNLGTGVGSITSLDTNDRIEQTSTGAKGNIMQVFDTIQHANTTYEHRVRVWQDELQREPGNKNWANDAITNSKHFTDASQSTLSATGTLKIVKVEDEGILGRNAVVTSDIGANGSINSARVIDSGFSYRDGETVTFASSERANAIQATGTIGIKNVANAEGVYATTRSHLSSARGFLQDSNFYQEFSYEIEASVALERYRDIALRLVHPAGQKFFGKFKTSTNAMSQSVSTASVRTKKVASGTIAINNNANTITGTSTSFLSQFSNNAPIIIGPVSNVFYRARLNIVSSDTSANLHSNWTHGNITSANAHYFSGTVT